MDHYFGKTSRNLLRGSSEAAAGARCFRITAVQSFMSDLVTRKWSFV